MKTVKAAFIVIVVLYSANSMAVRGGGDALYVAPGTDKAVQCTIQGYAGDKILIQLPTSWLRSLLPFKPNIISVDNGCVIKSENSSAEEYAKELLFEASQAAAADEA